MTKLRGKPSWLQLLLVALGIAVVLTAPYGLTAIVLRPILVQEDALHAADALTVMPGKGEERMRTGVRLFKEGLAKKMIFSGPWPGVLVGKARNAGVPSSRIASLKSTPEDYRCPKCAAPISGTAGDVRAIARLLEESGLNSLIVVTSDYHSARTASAFREFLHDGRFQVMVVPAESHYLDLWWKGDRWLASFIRQQLQKTLFSLLSERLPDCSLHPLHKPLSNLGSVDKKQY